MKKWIAGISAATLLFSAAGISGAAAPAEDARLMDGSTLVTFGDSLTALSSWPQASAEELNMHLVNSGIGGHTSADALNRFDRDVASKDPDFVTIAFGTNDFVRLKGTQSQVSLADFRTNMETIVDKVKALDAVPILFTAPYVREDAYPGEYAADGGLTAVLDTYNAVIREIAEEKGVDLVDMRAMCEQYERKDFLVSDGVHLSDLGKKAYTDTLVSYMREHYRSDPDAPRVEQPQRPSVEPGAWTKSIISFDPADWMTPQSEALIKAKQNEDGSLSIYNTNGLWPEMHYSPSLDKGVAVPLEGTVLNYDITTGAGSNIILFFNGSTPTLAYDFNYADLPRALKKYDSSVKLNGDDLVAGQHLQGSIPLTELGIPATAIDEDGNVLISGVKVYAVGNKNKEVVIKELSVTTGVDVNSDNKEYETLVSLLPTEEQKDRITPDQGLADVTFNEDGSLRLFRAEGDTLEWPSIAIALDETVDLSTNPFLHLKFALDGGTANGFLHYTDENGAKKSAQFSDMVYGIPNDFEGDGDEYIDLSAKLGTTGVITLDKITLSVYGSISDAVIWQEIALAKEVEKPAPTDPDPTDSDPTDSTAPTDSDPTQSADPSQNPTDSDPSQTSPTGEKPSPSTGEAGLPLAGAMILLAVSGAALGISRRKQR